MDAATCRDQICDAGFGPLAELAQPAFVLEGAAGGSGVGRLGGLPRLPEGTAWPRHSAPNFAPWPLTFIAEFELAALDPAIWPGPRSDSLSVFCDVDDETLWVHRGGSALVIHHPAGVTRVPVEYPDDLGEELRYRERLVAARAVVTLPPGGTHPTLCEFGEDDPDEERAVAYWRLRTALLGVPEHWTPHHQLLGWPLRTDPSLLSEEPWPDLHADAIALGHLDDTSPVDMWQVLLQVASDGEPLDEEPLGAQFGDGGTLAFAIPVVDLRAGRFDRVEAANDSA